MQEPLTAGLPATLVQPVIAPVDRRRPRWPGIVSFVLALLTVAGLATGVVLATSDLYLVATYTAWGAIAASGLAVALAVVALIGRFGSGWAAAGLILGVIFNPLVLTTALDVIGGLWA
ncbi:MAG: hypothetical protein ABIQ01_08345 [Pseudolysinimonas sp.]